jgi:glycosyltransferase involved in cell wall biosynthesis
VTSSSPPPPPLASVWMPSYNHAQYLPAAIESVLGQTLRDVELVIADDGSTDGSFEIAQGYAAAHPHRITLLTHPGHANLGTTATANLAYTATRGRFVAGMASDDMLYPDSLERRVAHLQRNPRLGFVYGYAHLVDGSGRRLPVRAFGTNQTRAGRTLERLIQGNQIPGVTLLLRRECTDQAGIQDRRVFYSDWELWIRAAAHWEAGFIARPLAMYRVHGSNTGYAVPREVNIERSLEVMNVIRDRAETIGGRLTEPRIRATVELQVAFLSFAAGELRAAEAPVRAAFDFDRSLSTDGRWLADWLRGRLVDPLLPDEDDRFAPWLVASLTPHLEPRAHRTIRRAVAAGRLEATAVRAARAGEMDTARTAVRGVLVRSPRLLRDRQLAAILLDSVAGGRPGAGLRRAKRRVLGYR